MLSIFRNFMIMIGESAENTVDPLYDAIDTLGPYAIGVVALLGIVYCVILGVKFSKAENSQEADAAKKQLTNAIIGVVAIIILLSILYAIRGSLVSYGNS